MQPLSAIHDEVVRSPSWQRELGQAIRDPDELIDLLQLDDSLRPAARLAAAQFPLLVPRGFLARMRPGDPDDPLLRQILPLGVEEQATPGFVDDAVGDLSVRRAPGLLHKYAGRALLIAAGACAVHCRYCFRRHYPYADDPRRLLDWEPALEVIAADDSLQEVILSGGDPLMLTDQRLHELLARIEQIPHVTRLRIHTRLPIVLPERITPRLLESLRETRLACFVVVHANHPRELDDPCGPAVRSLVRHGLTVLNQAVLLRGVNDDLETLVQLCTRLIDLGVLPYYLHQLDRVSGTAHFEVPEETGRQLVTALRARLPGYAVPQYVREIPGAASKTPL